MDKKVSEIQKLLEGKGIYADYVTAVGDGIAIYISWGDWKHDHCRLDYILESAYEDCSIRKVVTEENGTDCYSAIHYVKGVA